MSLYKKTLSLEITINQTFYGKMEAWPKWKKNVQPFIKLLKNHGLYQHIDFDTFVSSLYHPKNLTRSLLDFVISEKKSSIANCKTVGHLRGFSDHKGRLIEYVEKESLVTIIQKDLDFIVQAFKPKIQMIASGECTETKKNEIVAMEYRHLSINI